MTELPDWATGIRGQCVPRAALAPYTWFRVGGPADVLLLPADRDDLADVLHVLPPDSAVTVLGVGSNTIVRDGGIEGVVVRLAGRYWGEISVQGDHVTVRAGALDLAIAKTAARAGISGLSFLSGIPGSIGGAVRTNAGCYGRELSDVLVEARGLTRSGKAVVLRGPRHPDGVSDIQFSYRHSNVPGDLIVTDLVLQGEEAGASPDTLAEEIAAHQARRAETQPIREKTGGSTFANPDPPSTPNGRSAWKLIDAAGLRGARVGGAQVSEKHCNFLINSGEATANDLEALGELVRARVREHSGVELRWEIRRIGRTGNTPAQ